MAESDARNDPTARQRVLHFYDVIAPWLKLAVRKVAEDGADAVIAAGRERFDGMLAELPYVDTPKHTMAPSMFSCASMLALYEELRERQVDVHAWGRALHSLPAAVPKGDADADERSRVDAAASSSGARPNEFVFEIVDPTAGDEGSLAVSDGGMNIKSCAICHLFAKYDAMDLVPYMCSFDDVMSKAGDQGLRRSGTIALGATQCDFRFRSGGEPLTLAVQYPEKIRLAEG